MSGGTLLGIGATFVAFVLGGFVLGLVLANRTGASWWVIVGTFAGLFAGLATFATQIVRSVK
ncbi:MAG TPA: AtpZ/AtpI family protein [Candidatus Acidoferrum sp.]|nr:AtpZ/AtpI family protein [Candidatus Acidoferrum sp.]